MVFSEVALLYWWYQGLFKPWGVGRGFQGECTLMAGAEVLGMLHLHEQVFQILAGHVLRGREVVRPVIWLPDHIDYLKSGGSWGS